METEKDEDGERVKMGRRKWNDGRGGGWKRMDRETWSSSSFPSFTVIFSAFFSPVSFKVCGEWREENNRSLESEMDGEQELHTESGREWKCWKRVEISFSKTFWRLLFFPSFLPFFFPHLNEHLTDLGSRHTLHSSTNSVFFAYSSFSPLFRVTSSSIFY